MALIVVLIALTITFFVLNIAPLVVIGLFILSFAVLNKLEKNAVD